MRVKMGRVSSFLLKLIVFKKNEHMGALIN